MRAATRLPARATSMFPSSSWATPADDACTPSHTHRLFDSIRHERKRLHEIQGATHYYTGSHGREHLNQAISAVDGFVSEYL